VRISCIYAYIFIASYLRISTYLLSTFFLAAVAYLVLPYEQSHWHPLLLRTLPVTLFTSYGYNPALDRTANLMMISAILGYIVMSGLCSLLDLVSPKEWKCQGPKSYMGVRTWVRVVGTCVKHV